ncbi:hypothetical protein QQG74_24110 [Micromonospora sp. FIMYZ51]|uniref:hypothetical protein n=1 Tax=Micromonospora sp. FIMYZ51 TaxID=3051832 RepID=UPI00311ED0EA
MQPAPEPRTPPPPNSRWHHEPARATARLGPLAPAQTRRPNFVGLVQDGAGGRTLVTTTAPHMPLRPLWLCRACAAPWPCGSARVTLLREYAHDRVALLVYLGGQLHDAAEQLYRLNPNDGPNPKQLFDRFLGWARLR